MNTTLNQESVEAIFQDCMLRPGEVPANAPRNSKDYVFVEGTVYAGWFSRSRVNRHLLEIEGLLKELPEKFRMSGGRGWTFSNAFRDRRGRQWASSPDHVDHLLLLGLAVGKVKYCRDRESWTLFDRRDPYFVFVDV